MKELKVLAGITKDNELYFLEISPKTKEHDYFSISGFTVEHIKEDDGEELARESIADDPDLWKQAVAEDQTTLGFSDWVDLVLDTEAWQDLIDCSLYPESFNYSGVEYWFKSGGCRQHEIKELAFYTIGEKEFSYLMKLWKKNHLKDYEISKRDIDWLKEYQKNEEELMKKAFDYFNKEDLI